MTSDTDPARVTAHIVYPSPEREATGSNPYLVLPATMMGVAAVTMNAVRNFISSDGKQDHHFAEVFDEIVLEITIAKVTHKRLTSDGRHVIDADADPTNLPNEEDDLE